MSNTTNRILALIKENSLTKARLERECGFSNGTIGNWEKGRNKPSYGAIVKIANFFSVSEDYLLGKSESNAVRVPVLGTIPAGIPLEAIEDITDYEEVPQDWARGGKEFFALKIKGESMMPEYRDGDVIILRKQNSCDNNEDCAVMVNGSDATFKRVEWLKGGVLLKPLNPVFESKFYTNEEIENLPVKIIGVFWELRRSRRR